MLTPAQQATIKSEIQNDPESLGYATYLNASPQSDYVSLATILDWVRDGITPCSVNNVVGPNGTITGATNASPIVITATAHGRTTGDQVYIANVGGNTAANGYWTITVTGTNTFSLNGSTGNAAYTSGGTWNWCIDNVRNASVSAMQILGAIAFGDLITAGGASAVTADQFGKVQIVMAMLNQSSGQVLLTNPDGSDNNVAKTLKQVVTAGTTSHAAIAALETRTGSRAEQLLGLSATIPGQLLAWQDVYTALTGQPAN